MRIFIQTCEKNCAAITTRRSRMTLGAEGRSILAALGKGSRREYKKPRWCELALIGEAPALFRLSPCGDAKGPPGLRASFPPSYVAGYGAGGIPSGHNPATGHP